MCSLKLKNTTQPSITKQLIEEHERIRVLLNSLKICLTTICKRLDPEEIQKAQAIALQLSTLKSIHTAYEEEALFPALAKYHPLLVMEQEHEELLLKRAELVAGILNYSFPEDCTNLLYQQGIVFLDLLSRHMEKEEQAVFPLAEQSLSSKEKQQVVAKYADIKAMNTTKLFSELTPEAKKFHFPFHKPITERIQTKSLMKLLGIEIAVLELKAGASLATRWSTKQVILLLCNGEAVWSSENKNLTLHEGDGMVLEPLLPHSVEASHDCRFLMVLNEYVGTG